MTHEQKPESVEFRTLGTITMTTTEYDQLVKTAEARGAAEQDTYQSRVDDWMAACFGAEISADRTERNHRFLEEAIELVQSTGCTQSEAHQLVDYVYGRPVGDPVQEVGGVMVTLAAFCSAHGITLKDASETELARIWTKVEKIRAKQAAKPKHSPLPEHVGEQRRKDAEGVEPVAYRWAYDVPRGRDSLWHFGGDLPEPRPERPEPKHVTPLYTHPANVAALEDRVKELEGEVERRIAEAVAAEREKIAGKLDEVAKHLARPWGSYLTEEGIAVKEACAARVEQEAAAIREGGEHG